MTTKDNCDHILTRSTKDLVTKQNVRLYQIGASKKTYINIPAGQKVQWSESLPRIATPGASQKPSNAAGDVGEANPGDEGPSVGSCTQHSIVGDPLKPTAKPACTCAEMPYARELTCGLMRWMGEQQKADAIQHLEEAVRMTHSEHKHQHKDLLCVERDSENSMRVYDYTCLVMNTSVYNV